LLSNRAIFTVRASTPPLHPETKLKIDEAIGLIGLTAVIRRRGEHMSEDRSGLVSDFFHNRLSRRSALGRIAGAGAIGALSAASVSRFSASASQLGVNMNQASPSPVTGTPTIVLVHGAWADSSGWTGVINSLKADGFDTIAFPNPLRGPVSDGAYVAALVNSIPGPVLLVGHSYGGAVITNAGAQTPNAVGLVYVAAFAPDEGESIQDLASAGPPTKLFPALHPVPVGNDAEIFLDRAQVHEVFCADLSAEDAAIIADTQRPAAASGFDVKSGPAAWKTLPSWFAVAKADNVIGAEGERVMAQRAGSVTVEIDASHVVMISQPEAIADLIRTAVGSLS
jgi:pimeloyl-ACP methyl ester carboxylesterase